MWLAIIILAIAVAILFARLNLQTEQMMKCLELMKQLGDNQNALDHRCDLLSQRLDLQTKTIQLTDQRIDMANWQIKQTQNAVGIPDLEEEMTKPERLN